LKKVLLRMGRADNIDDVMKDVDKNGSGEVDFEEFRPWFMRMFGPNHGDHMRELSRQGLEDMQIFVTNAHAQKFTIWVGREETIESVRAKMQDKEGHAHDDESVLTYDPDGVSICLCLWLMARF